MGINIGSLLSPLIVGAVKAQWGYHAGFLVAAIGMAIALICFVGGRKLLAGAGDYIANPIQREERWAVARIIGGILLAVVLVDAAFSIYEGFGLKALVDTLSLLAFITPIVFFVLMYRSPKVTAPERSRLVAYIPLFVAAMLFFMIFEQAATTLANYAIDNTTLSFLWWDSINPESFQSINPLFIILLAPLFAWMWVRTKDRPATPYKFAIGLALAALSFLFLAAASALAGGGQTPAWVLGVVYVIQTVGELCISPVGLAATTLLAPRAFRGQAMALWFLAPAAGQAITAQLVQTTEGMAPGPFFGGIGVVALVFAGIVAALGPWVLRRMRSADEAESAAEPVAIDVH
jgi:POT family proton-dependent oligopeptide transporter